MRTIIDILTTDQATVQSVQYVAGMIRDHRSTWRPYGDEGMPSDVKDYLSTFLLDKGLNTAAVDLMVAGEGSYHRGIISPPRGGTVDDASEQLWAMAVTYNMQPRFATDITPETSPTVFATLISLAEKDSGAALHPWIVEGLLHNKALPAAILEALASNSDFTEDAARAVVANPNTHDRVTVDLVTRFPSVAESAARNTRAGVETLRACAAALTVSNHSTGGMDWSAVSRYRSIAPLVARHENVTDDVLMLLVDHARVSPGNLLDASVFAAIVSSPIASAATLRAITDLCTAHDVDAMKSLTGAAALMSAANVTPELRALALKNTMRGVSRSYLSEWEVNQAAEFIAKAVDMPESTWRSFLSHRKAGIRAAAAIATRSEHFEDLLTEGKPASLVAAFCQNEGFREWLGNHPSAKTRARCVTLALAASDSEYATLDTPTPDAYLTSEDEVLRAAAVRTVEDAAVLAHFAMDPAQRVRDAAGRRLGKALIAA